MGDHVAHARLLGLEHGEDGEMVCIQLNQPVDESLQRHFWRACGLKVAADGGADRIPAELRPDVLVGDMDSCSDETEARLRDAGVEVRRVACQDTTDLQKCLRFVRDTVRRPSATTVVLLGATGGRIDHEMAAFHAMLCDQWVPSARTRGAAPHTRARQ